MEQKYIDILKRMDKVNRAQQDLIESLEQRVIDLEERNDHLFEMMLHLYTMVEVNHEFVTILRQQKNAIGDDDPNNNTN